MGLGSGIRKKPIPDSGSRSRGQKSTGSRIRIRNTAVNAMGEHACIGRGKGEKTANHVTNHNNISQMPPGVGIPEEVRCKREETANHMTNHTLTNHS
jgi:hypothetical protein